MIPPWRLTVLSALLAACPGKGADPIAKLTEALKQVEKTSDEKDWKASALGDAFVEGNALRTGAASSARLELTGGGGLRLGENALIRFGRGDRRLDLELGEARVEAPAGGAAVRVAAGSSVVAVEPGSTARLSAVEGKIHFDVLVGSATIESGGQARTVAAGQSLDVAIGGAVIETPPDAPPPDAAPVPDAGPPPPVAGAVRAKIVGRGVQARPDEGAPWKPIAGEVELGPGTQLKLGRRAQVELTRGDEKSTVRGVAELTVGPAEGALANVARGGVIVVATTGSTRIDMPGGSVTAKKAGGPGSRGDFTVVPRRDTQVHVRAGYVEIRGRGMVETLAGGETAALTGGGDIRFAGKPPDYADFSIPAGESPFVHDPKPPTAIRIKFADKCPGKAGVVEMTRRGRWERPDGISRGDGQANVLVPRGAMSYRVRCLVNDQVEEKAIAQGTIRIIPDRGQAPIPKRAPKNIVDADGRRYTVLYQNLLPQLTFRWRQPPTSEVQLKFSNGKENDQVIPAPGAQILLESGRLPEGRYEYWFEAVGDARIRSPKTTLVIDFDNAAPTASVKEPPASGFTGTQVKVSGVALEGWSVSVGGLPLKSDARLRFAGDVAASGDERGLAIKLVHPSRGVHYYLRRRSQ